MVASKQSATEVNSKVVPMSKTYTEAASGTNTDLNPGIAGEWDKAGVTCCYGDMS